MFLYLYSDFFAMAIYILMFVVQTPELNLSDIRDLKQSYSITPPTLIWFKHLLQTAKYAVLTASIIVL